MKRKAPAILLTAAAILAALWVIKPSKTDLGSSELYSEAEIRQAVQIVRDRFRHFHGCTLFSLSYAGDERSLAESDYNKNYDEAIVINSVFLSPIIRAGAWDPHEIYTWSFILMRENGGKWELLTYGYG